MAEMEANRQAQRRATAAIDANDEGDGSEDASPANPFKGAPLGKKKKKKAQLQNRAQEDLPA